MILGSLECNVPPCMRLALDITPNNCLAWPLWCNKFHNRHREFGTNQARSKSHRELFCFCLKYQPTMILSKSRRKTHMYIHPLGIYTNSYAIRKKLSMYAYSLLWSDWVFVWTSCWFLVNPVGYFSAKADVIRINQKLLNEHIVIQLHGCVLFYN